MAIPCLNLFFYVAFVILMQLFCCVGGVTDIKSHSKSGLCDGRQHNDCVTVQSSALNVTVQKPLSNNQVWIMYEDSKNVNDSKCFTLNISNEAKCDNQVPIYYDCHVKNSNRSTIMTPNFVTTIRAVANEKRFLFKFRNLFSKFLFYG